MNAPRVGVAIANDRLRGLVRVYLERSGYDVIDPETEHVRTFDFADADVVVTETSAHRGRLLTIRLTEATVMPRGETAIALSPDDLVQLPEVIATELARVPVTEPVRARKGKGAAMTQETMSKRTKVGDVGRADLAGVQLTATMADAARLMNNLDVGSAAVFADSDMVGIVTERDVMRAALDGADLNEAPVMVYMTKRPATIRVDAEVAQAALAMRALHARHLPVVDGSRIVGMVSARDLLEALCEDAPPEVPSMRPSRWPSLWRRRPRIAEAQEAVQLKM
jgi:CBS domain-containing protein